MKKIISALFIICFAFSSISGAADGDNFPMQALAAYSSNLKNKELLISNVDLTGDVTTCASGFDKCNLVGKGGYDLFFSRVGDSAANRHWRTEDADVQITVTGDAAFVCNKDPDMRIPVDLYFFAWNQEASNEVTVCKKIIPGVPLTYSDFGYISHFHIYAFPTTAGMMVDPDQLAIGNYTLRLTVLGTGTKTNGSSVVSEKTSDFILNNKNGEVPIDNYYLTCVLEQSVSYINLAEFCTSSTVINTTTGGNNKRDNDVQVASLTVTSNIPQSVAQKGNKYPSIVYSPLDDRGVKTDRYYFYCLQDDRIKIPYTLAKNNKDNSNRRIYTGTSEWDKEQWITWADTSGNLQADQTISLTPDADTKSTLAALNGSFIGGTYVTWIQVEVIAPDSY